MSSPIGLTVQSDKLPPHLRQYFQPVSGCGKCYVCRMVEVFREVRRVLRDDGTVWLNLGDSYAGSGKGQYADGENDPKKDKTRGMKLAKQQPSDGLKPKDLIGIPWRVAFALQSDGWYLRSDIIWHKTNCMPESVQDRPTKAHEYVFLLSKSERYFYDADAIREPHTDLVSIARHKDVGRGKQAYAQASGLNNHPQRDSNSGLGGHENGRNKRSVWSIPTEPYSGAHFAVMSPELAKTCILAGSAVGDVVLDPFSGAGTTSYVANKAGRRYIGIELNPTYVRLAEERIHPSLWDDIA